jgi:hypothetical protein
MKARAHFLASVAALFLATGAAHADNGKWQSDFRHCTVTKQFTHDPKDEFRPGRSFGDADEVFVHENSTATITLDLENVLELQKHVPLLKKCSAFWQCVADREQGKVKHCYENDRRWR